MIPYQSQGTIEDELALFQSPERLEDQRAESEYERESGREEVDGI